MSWKERWKTEKRSWFTIVSFFGVIAVCSVCAVLMPDEELSKTERRHYEKLPALTWKAVADGSYMSDMEDYLLDHFVGRDMFRTLKTELETRLLGKKDANQYVSFEDYLYELDLDWNPDYLKKAAKGFGTLCEEYFSEANVYYALIPDKSSFLPKEKYPIEDDAWVLAQMQENLVSAEYIDLYPYLSVEDYYKTDLHWKQESIVDAAEALKEAMQQESDAERPKAEYEKVLVTDSFYGGYAGASAFFAEPDELFALTNDVIAGAKVYDYEKNQETTVYAPEKIEGMDPYDYYLWGARALLTIKNPECENGKRLILFRDSFGSSIAPLLLDAYEEITLVDLRYLSADYLPKLIELDEYEDVLFLYSQRVLRHSNSLKF